MAALKPHAGKADYDLAFKGFHYPISKSAILNMGRDKGGIEGGDVEPDDDSANGLHDAAELKTAPAGKGLRAQR